MGVEWVVNVIHKQANLNMIIFAVLQKRPGHTEVSENCRISKHHHNVDVVTIYFATLHSVLQCKTALNTEKYKTAFLYSGSTSIKTSPSP